MAVSDLKPQTVNPLIAICPPPLRKTASSDGTVDGTHFQENGARIMAGFVMDGIAEAGLGLARYRK